MLVLFLIQMILIALPVIIIGYGLIRLLRKYSEINSTGNPSNSKVRLLYSQRPFSHEGIRRYKLS